MRNFRWKTWLACVRITCHFSSKRWKRHTKNNGTFRGCWRCSSIGRSTEWIEFHFYIALWIPNANRFNTYTERNSRLSEVSAFQLNWKMLQTITRLMETMTNDKRRNPIRLFQSQKYPWIGNNTAGIGFHEKCYTFIYSEWKMNDEWKSKVLVFIDASILKKTVVELSITFVHSPGSTLNEKWFRITSLCGDASPRRRTFFFGLSFRIKNNAIFKIMIFHGIYEQQHLNGQVSSIVFSFSEPFCPLFSLFPSKLYANAFRGLQDLSQEEKEIELCKIAFSMLLISDAFWRSQKNIFIHTNTFQHFSQIKRKKKEIIFRF